MKMIKIPKDLQSLISASYHVNSFKRAVEELVYNSLDASSTSIAIRVNIQDNFIQVIDNGFGIKQNDFTLLGQRYTTSKFDNISVVKCIPHTYGFRGLSLASIIDISSRLRIVSRFMDSKDTLCKTFHKGEVEEIVEINSRPSKGTTVEIYGVFCNLKIQKKTLELSNELFAIKTLLEKLSLMHVNVSFSLRDDMKNEITFKIQKNRDIFQTISSLFNISSHELQEISVEKYQHKARAFIENRNADLKKYHWMFLNGKYISKTKVHKIVNKYFLHSHPRNHYTKNDHEGKVSNQLPTYFLFISCPYSEYDILNSDSNKTIVEFKNWQQITNLLEKLVQCYTGDIKLKEISKPKNINIPENKETNTREQMKHIIDKILTKNSKKQNVQLRNGIKGKEIKRKHLKKMSKRTSNINMDNQSIKNKIPNLSCVHENLNCQRKRIIKTTIETKEKTKILNQNKCTLKSKINTLNNIPFLKTMNEKQILDRNSDKLYSTMLPNTQQEKRKDKLCEYATDTYVTFDSNRPHEPGQTKQQAVFELNPIKDGVLNVPKEHLIDMHPKHLLQDVYTRNVFQNSEKKIVMTRYDLVQTVASNFKSIGNFVEYRKNNVINIPKYTRCYPDGINKGILSNKLTFESHQYGIHKNKKSHSRLNPNMPFINKVSVEKCITNNNNKNNSIIIPAKKSVAEKYKQRCIINEIKFGLEQSLYTFQNHFSLSHKNEMHGKLYSKSIDVSFDKCNTIFNSIFESERQETNAGKSYADNNNKNSYGNINEYRVTYSIKSSRMYTEVNEIEDNDKNNGTENDLGPTFSKNIETCNDLVEDKGNDLGNNSHCEIVNPMELCDITYNKENFDDENNIHKNTLEPNMDVVIEDNSKHNETEPNKNVTSRHFNTDEINEIFLDTFNSNTKKTTSPYEVTVDPIKHLPDFNLKSRYTFVPKGMSPIFVNGNVIPTYSGIMNLDYEYYKDAMYEKFAEKVMETAQIFEPTIQNVNSAIPKDGVNNNKTRKDNADLMFDAESIRKVLGQVDCKFIVTILSGKTITKNSYLNYLVMFDQHAVHERIRLEQNLSDYFDGLVWKCVNIDAISFRLSKDDTTFLHNHKDKLSTFGLQWSVDDNIVSVHAIPEAILGKNPRQADVVLKATKCLLSELIEALKKLKGNIPLYPKSIMNLVYSEACRYAIMFGDKLSKSECVNLINSLSECKMPFQCAHGRPVMAVIVEICEQKPQYMVNDRKILEFRSKCNIFK